MKYKLYKNITLPLKNVFSIVLLQGLSGDQYVQQLYCLFSQVYFMIFERGRIYLRGKHKCTILIPGAVGRSHVSPWFLNLGLT